jgi:threonine/homoserine/homoserine lactone efflux protein
LSIVKIFVSAFIIGLSGAMMPGPLLTYNINATLRRGFIAGPLLIVGHSLLELALIILIILGFNKYLADPVFTGVLGITGGGVLLWMSYGMISSAVKKEVSMEDSFKNSRKKQKRLILPGALLSISNPYWVLWWATIGLTYLTKSYKFGITGIVVFYLGHILSDFSWYSFVSWIVAMGKKIMNDRVYRVLIIVFGLLLLYFAGFFILDGIKSFIKFIE